MTTPEEALKHALSPSEDEAALITAACKDPLIQIWPDITGMQKGTLVASSALMEVLSVTCSVEGNIDAEAAICALGAARDHIMAAVKLAPGERTKLENQGATVAQAFRARMVRFTKAEIGDSIGILQVGAHEITIKKDGPAGLTD